MNDRKKKRNNFCLLGTHSEIVVFFSSANAFGGDDATKAATAKSSTSRSRFSVCAWCPEDDKEEVPSAKERHTNSQILYHSI